MLDYLIVKVSDFMDKQQKELSKRFGNTHWLSSPKHVEQFLMVNTFLPQPHTLQIVSQKKGGLISKD